MIHSRKVIALLPIKEESERVPGKNFRGFAGKPLYQHIVYTLDRTYAIDEIIIDTDSPRIMLDAPKLTPKVRIIERPAELCGGMVSTNLIFAHDMSLAEGDLFVQTHATNPLLRSETIAQALAAFLEAEAEHDSLFSVNTYYSRFYKSDGTTVNHDPENLIRTQDLPPLFEENSCLYVFTRESFGQKGRRIGLKPMMFPTPPMESIDIDDEFAFRLAELLALYSSRDLTA